MCSGLKKIFHPNTIARLLFIAGNMQQATEGNRQQGVTGIALRASQKLEVIPD